jgi:plastocyanin
MRNWMASGALLTGVTLAAMAVACGGGNGGNDPPSDDDPLVVARTTAASGNGQTGTVGDALPSELRVIITRSAEPQEGVGVTWATPDGGSLVPAASDTDADGIATTTWTLGPDVGEQTTTATVADADGSPVSFTATAEDDTPPPPPPPPPAATIQVLGVTGANPRFQPTQVIIQAGETVLWTWPNGSLRHNVVPDDDQPTSSGGLEDGPMTYSFTFNAAGTYDFYCSNHGGPGGFGMSGTVTVEP